MALHPTALARHRQQVESLAEALSQEKLGGDHEPVTALRELISAVVITPTAPGDRLTVEVRGRLAI